MLSGGGVWVGITNLGDKIVRSTRFYLISSGTSGTVNLPALSTVVLDDFGGPKDAMASKMLDGKPTFETVTTALGAVVEVTFDSSGNYTLSGVPSSYPVAIVYRVQQRFEDFDSTSSDVVGESSSAPLWGQIEGSIGSQADLYENFVSLGGKLVLSSRTVNTNANIISSDYYIGCNPVSSITVNLPSIASCEIGQCFAIKDEVGSPGVIITVAGSDGALIDGLPSFQISNREGIEVMSRGSFWAIK